MQDSFIIGLEDDLYLDSDRTVVSGPLCVAPAVELGRQPGRHPATIAETRHGLGA